MRILRSILLTLSNGKRKELSNWKLPLRIKGEIRYSHTKESEKTLFLADKTFLKQPKTSMYNKKENNSRISLSNSELKVEK